MSTKILFSNNAQTTLAGAITSAALTANLSPGSGVEFPSPGAGEFFVGTFTDAATGLVNEIVHVTNVTGDVITMVRAQEGTTAQNWSAGDGFSNFNTKGTMDALSQISVAQTGGTNYAIDSGTANNYVCSLSPSISAHVVGMPIRVKIANSNTGASTLNPGPGSAPVINPDGTALGSASIQAGGIYTFTYDGTSYQLSSASDAPLSSQGIATTGATMWRPTEEVVGGWVKANATTIGNVSSSATQLASLAAQALYVWTWNNFSNSQCPVTGGRGANALADFVANKAIQVLDMKGTGIMGMDTMGGSATTRLSGVPVVSGSATVAGSILGENLHQLVTSELPTITPAGSVGITDAGHTHPFNTALNKGLGRGAGAPTDAWGGGNNPDTTSSSTTGITAAFTGTPFGSNGSHNTVQRSMVGTWYLKL